MPSIHTNICNNCAEKKKLTWPSGHLATHWMGRCDYCGEYKGLCSIYDYEGEHMNGKVVSDVRD